MFLIIIIKAAYYSIVRFKVISFYQAELEKIKALWWSLLFCEGYKLKNKIRIKRY